MARPKFRRADLKPGENLCSYCTAKCCRYYALPIDTPTTWQEFDYIRWFMIHGRTAIFVDDDTWYLMVYGDCQHLLPDYRCGIYETRPQICRDYSFNECEYDNDGCYDKFFESAEQIWEYAEAVLPPKPKPKKKAGLPSLPVISV
jgi:Fe-S-cluster containining protein